MEFEEPGLEELIQNDLRSEMNKILSQSEVEELEAAAEAQHETPQSPFEPGTSSRNQSHAYRAEMVVKTESDTDEMHQYAQMVHGGFDLIGASSLQDLSQHNQLPRGNQEISGHFAVGSYADFNGEMGHFPPGVTEHGDLQSLTWLTTVDVQALQKLTEQGTVITSAMGPMTQAELTQAQGAPEHRSVIQLAPTSNAQVASSSSQDNSAASSLQSDPSATAPTTPPRYMPIQPNMSPESRRYFAQQRYHLHGHPGGGPMGRHSFDSAQGGPRRYIPGAVMGHHPYPPPPYTAGRGAYGPIMHHRYHQQVHQQKVYPKPVYSYSCLIAMALYNSKTGCLPVSEIYSFMMENYPYFKTAPDGWKNSVRHNLSLNKCFEKVEKPNGSQRKGCLWALNPAKIAKMKEEVQKWKRKDPDSIRRSMSNPEELDRELEEMRRADEETARRRMLSLSSHGLTASSLHGGHPHHHPHQQRHPPSLLAMHPHSLASHRNSTAGLSSHPNTSQRRPGLHFSTELAQQNFALTLARSASQPSPGRTNPYDLSHRASSQVTAATDPLNYGSNNNNNSNPDARSDMIVLTPGGGKSAFFASPHSVSSSSSNNTSLLGTFTDCTSGLGVEEDFDASLADLAGLHDSFWDSPLDSQPGTSRDIGETYAEIDATKSILPTTLHEDSPSVSSDGHIRLPPVIRMLSSTQSEQASPDTPDYKTTTANQRMDNFGRDLSHYANNNSIKPVVML